MTNKTSTCLYIDRAVLETARQIGLNVSKVSEKALIRAIGMLQGAKPGTGLDSQTPEVVEGKAVQRLPRRSSRKSTSTPSSRF